MGQGMRVLVTGADGFVGRAVCRNLLRAGMTPRAALRDSALWSGLQAALPSMAEWAEIGDLGETPRLDEALAQVDAVIHLAARVHVMQDKASDPLAEYRRTNAQGTQKLAQAAAAAGVRRMVLISTIKVNGESTTERPFTEEDAPAPQDPYSVSKWEAEEALKAVANQADLEAAVVRPPLVYGPGVRANFLSLMKLAGKGIPLPLPETHNRRSLLGVENLADFLVRCTWHEAAANQTFLLSDGEDLSTRELVRLLAQAQGKQAHFLPVSVGIVRMVAGLLGKEAAMDRLLGSLVVDSSKARAVLNWSPPVTMEDGLEATVQWLFQR